ncbi:unnamed protein product [Lactuca saligna]|uniref:Reverse transcriptase domain-containing protein n=1 Tax=Lactuca saligna TaxID=75948 RepID=A0AA35ZSS6_LACSI|nr:unnamed protein product [Lactuca saligna]
MAAAAIHGSTKERERKRKDGLNVTYSAFPMAHDLHNDDTKGFIDSHWFSDNSVAMATFKGSVAVGSAQRRGSRHLSLIGTMNEREVVVDDFTHGGWISPRFRVSPCDEGKPRVYSPLKRSKPVKGSVIFRIINMDNMFSNQVGRNIEVYVDDIVIKRKNEINLLSDIAEIFDTLRKANMKLNPKKCTFGVETGQFLGYMITKEGIQANPEKKSKP